METESVGHLLAVFRDTEAGRRNLGVPWDSVSQGIKRRGEAATSSFGHRYATATEMPRCHLFYLTQAF